MSVARLALLAALAAGAPQATELPAPGALPHAAPGTWSHWRPEELPPEPVRAEMLAAVSAYAAHELVPSLRHLHAVLERAPDYPPALHQLGVVSFRLRRYGDAVEAFERFLAHAPGEVAATRALGHAYYSLGRYADALAHYGRVLAERPESVEALRGAALARYRLGDAEGALAGLERVLELEPAHAEAALWRARVLFDLGRLEPALEAAQRARELDAHGPQPWFLLSHVLYELGRDEEAEAAEARFRELDPLAQDALRLEARLLYEPRDSELWLGLVALRRAAGDRRGALEAGRRLAELAPERLEWRLLVLDLAEEYGDQRAEREAALALERHCPEHPQAWARLEEFYGRRGERLRQVQAGERRLRLLDAREREER